VSKKCHKLFEWSLSYCAMDNINQGKNEGNPLIGLVMNVMKCNVMKPFSSECNEFTLQTSVVGSNLIVILNRML